MLYTALYYLGLRRPPSTVACKRQLFIIGSPQVLPIKETPAQTSRITGILCSHLYTAAPPMRLPPSLKRWENYSPTSQAALQVPLRILCGVTILEIVRTQSARFLPSCFGIGGGGGVRTHAPLAGPTRFPSAPLHHLGTPPWGDRRNLNP